eukprot:1349228-Amorphochlora_amoeboformis.AAC.1
MPLKKCYSSPHLSHLVKVVRKENLRKPEVKFAKNTKFNGSSKDKDDVPMNGKLKLKKCFSSPHLKDLKELPEGSESLRPPSKDSSAFRNEVINCRFRSCGCTVRLSRERMDSHLRTNAATHSLLILNKIDDLGRQNESITKRLSSMENSMLSMMNLFENLQDVLASKGVSTTSLGLPKGLDDHAGRKDMNIEATTFMRSPTASPAGIEVKDNRSSLSKEGTKRMPDHLDLAIPTQPVKRQRKSPPLPSTNNSTTSNITNTSSVAKPRISQPQLSLNFGSTSGVSQHISYGATDSSSINMYSGNLASMAASSPLSLNGVPAASTMIGLSNNTNTTGAMHSNTPSHSTMSVAPFLQMGTHGTVAVGRAGIHTLDTASLSAQTKQAAKRVQDMMENKGKSSSSRRKVRGRVKKGKNIFEAPKKPKTAYNYYQIGVRESILAELMAENSGASKEVQSQKVARIIGERWKSMPDNEREVNGY